MCVLPSCEFLEFLLYHFWIHSALDGAWHTEHAYQMCREQIKIQNKKLPRSSQTAHGTLGDVGAVTVCLEVVDKCLQILLSEHHVNELSCSFPYKITCQLHLDDSSVIAM